MRLNKFLALGITVCAATMSFAQSNLDAVSKVLSNAKRGEVVKLEDFLRTDFPKINYHQHITPGPQFLIADDPEYIRIPEAIAMQEEVNPGAVRLYVYNVNGIREPEQIPRKITAVIKNLGKEDMHFRMLKYSSQKPSTNYFHIGKKGLQDYFDSEEQNAIRTIKPGEVVPIDEQLENQIVTYDQLVHGIRSEEHTSELQSRPHLVCRLLLEKKNK